MHMIRDLFEVLYISVSTCQAKHAFTFKNVSSWVFVFVNGVPNSLSLKKLTNEKTTKNKVEKIVHVYFELMGQF